MAIFYINGTTLSNSTAVFSDSELTTCAADGFYSDGSGISREQVSCSLGPIQSCPECLTQCNTGPLSVTTGQGTFLLDIDLGDTVSDIGAVIIKFIPTSEPDGIRATYNGTVYNTLSSDIDGLHSSSVSGGYVYVGNDGAPCVPVAGATYSNLPIYRYNGTSFADTGVTKDITPQTGELSFSLGVAPGNLYMVIPKLSSLPQALNIEMAGVCTGTVFGIEVSCPALLTGYLSSSTALPNSVDACAATVGSTYYNAPVAGTPGVPEVFDFVFYDAYGVSALVNGFYQITGSKWIEVANGIVITKGNC
jgi:hypothetical protein